MNEGLRKKMTYKGEKPCFLSIPDDIKPLFEEPLSEHKDQSDVSYQWVLICVLDEEALNQWMDTIIPKLEGDVPLWFAYPKKSSKRYKSSITRDSGWGKMGEYKMEPVRQIAIDDDWSALRFRKLEYIKTLTRRKSMRLTKDD